MLLIAVAPELDRAYPRLFALAQDDSLASRPTVDVMLRCVAGIPERRAARAALPHLVAEGLIGLMPDPRLIAPVADARLVVVDDQIRDVLLQQGGLDARLEGWCSLTEPETGQWAELPFGDNLTRPLRETALASWGRRPHRIHLRGPQGSGRSMLVAALAGELKATLLSVDLSHQKADAPGIRTAVREAMLHGAVLCVLDADRLADPQQRPLRKVLAGYEGLTVFVGTQPWLPGHELGGVIEVELPRPDYATRLRCWQDALPEQQNLAAELATRFHLGPGRIAEAVATAMAAAGDRKTTRAELFAAARGQGAHSLTTLTRRIRPVYTWANLVLPAEAESQLRELCSRVTQAPKVWHEWGFDRTIAHGRGTTALFAGPSGTGKTMAAEVVAGELGLDLFTVDLSSVISKYIGETEKNLERIFTAATEAEAVLLFDEADALFGKRSQVNDAHDRYANVEIAYLLQRMERYEGVAILASNLRTHLDEAFLRRLQFVIDFPFPDQEQRRRIFDVSLPEEAPRHKDLDLDRMAHEVRLAGGEIRNVMLHAAFLAAADESAISDEHLRAAVRHELRKLGRVLPAPLNEPVAG
jgi:AAA+ superfamily predicted ATPase